MVFPRRSVALALAVLLVGACGPSPGNPVPTASIATFVPPAGCATSTPSGRQHGPPSATPIAEPPAEPAGDGSTATICTELGSIEVELFTESAPVATENFINLAREGYFNGVVFHRLVPGFVIQGGDPQGTGRGGPGYNIQDEPVVGDYVRGIVAMARTSQPDSQGSQFFIVLDDLRQRLDEAGGYAIFGRVTQGMEAADAIAAMPNSGSQSGNQAIEPVAMTVVIEAAAP